MPLRRPHIARVAAKTIPHAFQQADFFGNRQGVERYFKGHEFLLLDQTMQPVALRFFPPQRAAPGAFYRRAKAAGSKGESCFFAFAGVLGMRLGGVLGPPRIGPGASGADRHPTRCQERRVGRGGYDGRPGH